MTFTEGASIAIIVGTLAGVAIGRLPRLRMNRATIALVGATGLVLVGGISLETAFSLIDWNTLALLLGMMVLNVNLRLSGFFKWVTAALVRRAPSAGFLMVGLVFSAGLLSALLLNDTIVLMLTPLVLEVTRARGRNPVPYLVALAVAANLGSVGTVIGNPQNMLIGVFSGISFLRFSEVLLPVALVGLMLACVVLFCVYRKEFRFVSFEAIEIHPVRIYRPLLIKSLASVGVLVTAMGLGYPLPLAAMAAGALLLVTRRLKPERVFRDIDWSLLVFFASLFVVTGAVNSIGFGTWLAKVFEPFFKGGVPLLAVGTALFSNVVSNVPAVLLLSPFVGAWSNPEPAWLTMAMASTFAGNMTLLGSVANLIVAETARRHGVELTFWEYLKVGLPVTILSIFAGIAWLT